jgi:hypothetical protein
VNDLRDLSVILLTIESFVLALIPLALFGGLVYVMWNLLRHDNLPTWLRLAREYLNTGLSYVEMAMEAIVKPILMVNSALATVQAWLNMLTKRGGS